MRLWCCQCQTDVDARLTDGRELYPHRPDLADVPRWICDGCGNHVGTHHKTADRFKPLGNIPNGPLMRARVYIHRLIDPYWKTKRIRRREIYKHLSKVLGRSYHTGELRTIEEARRVYAAAQEFIRTKLGETNETRDGSPDDVAFVLREVSNRSHAAPGLSRGGPVDTPGKMGA